MVPEYGRRLEGRFRVASEEAAASVVGHLAGKAADTLVPGASGALSADILEVVHPEPPPTIVHELRSPFTLQSLPVSTRPSRVDSVSQVPVLGNSARFASSKRPPSSKSPPKARFTILCNHALVVLYDDICSLTGRHWTRAVEHKRCRRGR